MPLPALGPRPARVTRRTLIALALTAAAGSPAGAQLVRSAAAGSAADAALLAAITDFRNDLGTLNGNLPVSFVGGRRQIDWDAVPEGVSSPNAFPGNFFNGNVAGRARGVLFTTPGTGFQVSANAGPGVQFGNIDPSYPGTFEPFSPNKLFTAIGSNIVDVEFRLPSDQTTTAMTRGFGVMFSDVNTAGSTSIEYFGFGGNSLGTFFAPSIAGPATFSFLGVSFVDPLVRRVRITSGNQVLAPGNAAQDLVVMDDFIYGEPVDAAAVVPEPATVTLVAGGLLALVAAARRRQATA